jgi:predicted Zn-dependent protease
VHAGCRGTSDALDPLVLATSFIRRELRGRRIQIGQAAQLLHGLVHQRAPLVRGQAISFALELSQIDPEEPHVRALSDDVYAIGEDGESAPEELVADDPFTSLGDALLHARTLLQTGRPRAAERVLSGVLTTDPQNPVTQTLLMRAKQMQGKLRDAVRIWQNLSGNRSDQSTLAALRAIYQTSLEPETTQGTAAGELSVVRLEIAQAFRLAAQARPDAGIELCDRIMERHRQADRALYKLAAIAKVWLLEAAGVPDGAIALAELLGGESDLADDVDRLLSLVRLVEMAPGKVRQAIEIYEGLFDKLRDTSILTRLARLHGRLGDGSRASALAKRHLMAFEQDLGYATLPQLLRAASRWHVPIRDFEHISFESETLEDEHRRLCEKAGDEARRKLGLVAILRRDYKQAETFFGDLVARHHARPVDLTYLGELAWLDGRPDLATAWYRDSLESRRANGEGVDGLALAALVLALDENASQSGPPIAVAEFSNGWDVRGAIAELARSRPSDPLVWRALARASRLLGCEEEGARHQVHAEFLERRGAGSSPPGHALAVAAYHAYGDRKGMVHELWVTRHKSSGNDAGLLSDENIFANLTDDFRTYLRGLFDSVKHYARARFPHVTEDIDAYVYEFKLTNEDERSSGPSAGLAIAMAFLSLFLDRPIPEDTAYSGVVVTEAHDGLSLRRVGDADIKVEGVLARRVRRFVLPLDCRGEIEQSDLVPPEASQRVVLYARDLDEALEAIFGTDIWLW